MSRFTHSCFISYRHGQGDIKQRFVAEFHTALNAELELLRNEQAFLDFERLKGGDFYNEALASALYGSATLIVIYQPNYFDLQHPYCAREYRAMRALERERLEQVPDFEQRRHGLIIPVVLRGPDTVPSELAASRQYEDFSKFMLQDRKLSKHSEYAPKIRAIAEYISERCESLEATAVSFDNSDMFQLPGEEETRTWIRTLNLRQIGFPSARGI